MSFRSGKVDKTFTTKDKQVRRRFDARKKKITYAVVVNGSGERAKTYICVEGLSKEELPNENVKFVDIDVPNRKDEGTHEVRICFTRATDLAEDGAKPLVERAEDILRELIIPFVKRITSSS